MAQALIYGPCVRTQDSADIQEEGTQMLRKLTTTASLALLAAALTSDAAGASDWEWSITPYLWGTDVSADVSINDRNVANMEIDFDDLAEDLEITTQGHVEGRRGRHGVMLDVFYVHLADDDKSFPLPAPLPGQATAGGDLTLTIADLGGVFNPHGDGEGFSLLYGARTVDRDIELDARFPVASGVTLVKSYAVSETLYDALLGARYIGRINPRWNIAVQANASTGGTELTWDALAGIGYSFGESDRYRLIAGYRHMDIEFEKDNDLGQIDAEVTLSGFFSGLRISF
jgi:hypothetical protein